ncbi:integrase catalytic domain-containing protein [Nephila pilipes]|uniref:Integrase catalytic domain-containing protein n=1 Tax=Nephila pilipes TaxID=299642 RepID=A0A8X6QE99_NEPPI|nr:integrase catalytic domain-containing protein [Nephila pilipes]
MQQLKHKPTISHARQAVFVHKDLKTCTNVFERRDSVRRLLQTPYDGPLLVLKSSDCGKYRNQCNQLASTQEGAALHHNDITFNKLSGTSLFVLVQERCDEIQSRERAQSFHSSVKEKQIPNSSNQECSSFAFGSRFHQNNLDKTTSNSRKEESDDSVASVFSCQTETKTQRVLLQTASVVARYNKQFRNCRLLADTAAQRSCVARKFSRLLKLPVIRKEKLSVYSFGDTSPVEKTFNVVKIRLENKDDPNSYLEIEALETEKISAAHIPPPDIDISIYSKHLKGLKLADTTNSDANVSVLIGADNYYDVMTGRIKRISRKLVATESFYGWCLIGISGPPKQKL